MKYIALFLFFGFSLPLLACGDDEVSDDNNIDNVGYEEFNNNTNENDDYDPRDNRSNSLVCNDGKIRINIDSVKIWPTKDDGFPWDWDGDIIPDEYWDLLDLFGYLVPSAGQWLEALQFADEAAPVLADFTVPPDPFISVALYDSLTDEIIYLTDPDQDSQFAIQDTYEANLNVYFEFDVEDKSNDWGLVFIVTDEDIVFHDTIGGLVMNYEHIVQYVRQGGTFEATPDDAAAGQIYNITYSVQCR